MKTKIQQPDHRNNGSFQFTVGYTGGFGAEMCVHLTREEYAERARQKLGDGELVDRGTEMRKIKLIVKYIGWVLYAAGAVWFLFSLAPSVIL